MACERSVSLAVLGPLSLTVDGTDVPVRSAMIRRLLALLVCHAGEPLGVGTLAEALWTDPPPSAADNLRQYVHRIRRILGDDRVVRDGRGYRLILERDELDADRFESLVARAGRAADPTHAVALLTEALDLWRGPALAEVAEATVVRPRALRLAEAQLLAVERRVEARLELGEHEALIPEVAGLVARNPLREHLRAHFMRALRDAGRHAEALEVYAQGRRVLAEELGLDPGPELRRLKQEIAAGGPASSPSPPAAAQRGPAELPPDPASFTGRGDALVRLRGRLAGGTTGPVTISVIAGAGGVGKSALAIHAAHQAAGRFPDGQLYVDLHGSTPNVKPLEPAEALGRMLRSLGIDEGSVPPDPDEAAGRFRSVTEGKRLLIVLDNARDARQVESLVPASPTCAVLVTSRRMLTGLSGARHERLDTLPAPDAAMLLTRLVGDERMEPHAGIRVAEECGRLPLAICIAAARLNARPAWTMRFLADRLGAERRLSELEAGDRGIRASFSVSYQELDVACRRIFRLISLLDGPDVGIDIAAALADLTPSGAEDLLDDLAAVQLVTEHRPGRYRLHDLIRLFARERAEEEEPPDERALAVLRGLHSYLATARAAVRLIDERSDWRADLGVKSIGAPAAVPETREEVYAWIDAESRNLLPAIRQAAGTPGLGPEFAVSLAAALFVPFQHRGRIRDELPIDEVAVSAVGQLDDLRYRAVIHGQVGGAHSEVGDMDAAIPHLATSLAAYRELGDVRGEASLLDRLAVASNRIGRADHAIEHFRQALELRRRRGDRIGEVITLANLGRAYRSAGLPAEATGVLEESITKATEVGDTIGIAVGHAYLATVLRATGRMAEALDRFRRALVLFEEAEETGTYDEAECLWEYGSACRDHGDAEDARLAWRRSAAILFDLNLIGAEEKATIDAAESPGTPEIIRRNQ